MAALVATTILAAPRKFTLVIDAGHGGKDSGALGKISKEKDLTLKFALAFGQMVERNCPDVNVIYTRKTDRFLELWQRAEIANKNKADLFISIHINSIGGGKQARGFQTYILGKGRVSGSTRGLAENQEVARRENAVIQLENNQTQTNRGYDPYSPESYIMFEMLHEQHMANSVELAKLMQKHVCAATGRHNGGAYQDNLAVLRLSSMPGCLIELGFISTRDEENYMNSKEAATQYAKGIYNAFIAYKKKYFGGAAAKPAPVERQSGHDNPQAGQGGQQPLPKESQQANPAKPDSTDGNGAHPKPQKPEGDNAPEPPSQPEAQQEQGENAPQKPQQPSQASSAPVFKVQFLTSQTRLKAGAKQFKGLTNVDSYKEGSIWKFTVGASANYAEIYRLSKEVQKKFPQAFIIAFRDGKRMDAAEAYREYKKNRGQ